MNTNIYLKISQIHIGFSDANPLLSSMDIGITQIINKININLHLLRMDQYSKNCRIDDVSSRRYGDMN